MHLKGHIDINSTPGKGTRIQIFLPVDQPIKASIPKQDDHGIQSGSEHILLVDDQMSIVQVMRKILCRLGYSVTACNGGTQALQVFESDPGRFDLVITDMTMPELTGDRLAGLLLGIRADIPVIICTGYLDIIPEILKENPAIKAYLPKPVAIKELAGTLRQVLD